MHVGVSLKITNKLIILLGGESGCLTLESEEGKGTTFEFSVSNIPEYS